jgi:hypothetical protein
VFQVLLLHCFGFALPCECLQAELSAFFHCFLYPLNFLVRALLHPHMNLSFFFNFCFSIIIITISSNNEE